MFGAMQHLLDAHLENNVRVRADPRASGGDIAQHRVQNGARQPVMDGVDPHKNAIGGQQLLADIVHDLIGINRRFGVDPMLAPCLRRPSARPYRINPDQP